MVQGLSLHAPNAGGLGLIPSQGTRSHMPQLRVHMPQLKDTTCPKEDQRSQNSEPVQQKKKKKKGLGWQTSWSQANPGLGEAEADCRGCDLGWLFLAWSISAQIPPSLLIANQGQRLEGNSGGKWGLLIERHSELPEWA